MITPDSFSEHYKEILDNIYDCVDRIVLNAYFTLAQSGGGFRTWWRILMGNDDNLNNTQLMRFAGRFSRRVRAVAEKNNIPLIYCGRNERKHEIAVNYIPQDQNFYGVFCILAGKAPAPIFEIKQFENGAIDIRKKTPQPYVNHYSFHIMDKEWGHVIIKLCPHPPYNAQIILNGHEYVARQARKQNIYFTKEDNCFTDFNDAAGLLRVADTMRASSSVGRLIQVCERWIYSACLCFALELDEQKRSGFHYSYSVYQIEYSRNLLFMRGSTMEQVFNSIIDRTRASLSIKTLKTIFGFKHRPFKRHGKGKAPRFEVAIERPSYNLTVFKIHFGKLTCKIYSKGERVLRIEVIAHNTKDIRCGRIIDRFPTIVDNLRGILQRFITSLSCLDVSFINDETLEKLSHPEEYGSTKVGGIDINKQRIRAVMEAIIAFSIAPRGFNSSDIARKVREIFNLAGNQYSSRHASYDLKKFRAKGIVYRINKSHKYDVSPDGLRKIMAIIVLKDKILKPLLANYGNLKIGRKPKNHSKIDIHYNNIQSEMKKVFELSGIAA